jgi:MFS-type transporter involved in bile tolerance (Atg22 family)
MINFARANKKFGIESDALGSLFVISNLVSAGANVLAPRVSKRLGTLKVIVLVISLCVPFYLARTHVYRS